MNQVILSLLGVVSLVLTGSLSQAGIITYTDQSTFLSELTDAQTLDFDSVIAGTVIPDGNSIDGITFNYPALAGFGVNLQVRDDFDTTSADNYLGTTDGGIFQGSDEFELEFGLSHGIGLMFISADPLINDDLILTAGGTSIGLDSSAIQQTLTDGSSSYFLGIVNDTTPFTSASIRGSGDFFFFNVDDITTSDIATVPEPSTLLLCAPGLVTFVLFRSRRNRQRRIVR